MIALIGSGSLSRIAESERDLALALKRALARGHFIEHSAEGKNVVTGVSFFAFNLLGRHVLSRANDGARRGERSERTGSAHRGSGGEGRSGCRSWTGIRHSERLGEAKIDELGTGLGEHEVAGLESAMYDPLTMRDGERFGDRDADLENLVHGQRAPAQALGQSFSFEKLHDQLIGAVV